MRPTITDPEGYKNNFLKVTAPKLEQHGIKYLVRSGAPKALVGEPPKNRLVITEAKDMETVMAFWNDSKDGFQIATKYANCRNCGPPLVSRKGNLILKYFLVRKSDGE